jgi:hypothetical protein
MPIHCIVPAVECVSVANAVRQDSSHGTMYWLVIASCVVGLMAAVLRVSAVFSVCFATVLLLGGMVCLLFGACDLSMVVTLIGSPVVLLVSFFLGGWLLSAIRKTDDE